MPFADTIGHAWKGMVTQATMENFPRCTLVSEIYDEVLGFVSARGAQMHWSTVKKEAFALLARAIYWSANLGLFF